MTAAQVDPLDIIFKDVKKRMDDKSLKIGEFGDDEVETLSTGIVSIDTMLNGGLPEGKIVEVFGSEQSGKTTLLLHCIAAAQIRGEIVYFIDAEHALDFSYARRIGVVPEKIQFTQPEYGEQALELARCICESVAAYNNQSPDKPMRAMVVIDSIPALVPKQQFDAIARDGFDSPVALGARARMLAEKVPALSVAASNSKTTVVFINQERDKIGVTYGPTTTQPGGRTVKFFASLRLKVTRTGQHKEAGNPVGIKTTITPIKSKYFQIAGRYTDIIIGNDGIDVVAPMIESAISMGIIEKKGSWYVFGDIRTQGIPAFKQKLFAGDGKAYQDLQKALKDGISK